MIFYMGTVGYLFYLLLIVGRVGIRKMRLTRRSITLLNLCAPGIGYYYNHDMKRSVLFFSMFIVLTCLLLAGSSVWMLASSMWITLATCEWCTWRSQSLLVHMKRLEMHTHKRPIVALDAQAMAHEKNRRKLWKLYEQSTYEFAITKEVIAQLQRENWGRQLELMFYERRLRIVDYHTQMITRHFPINLEGSDDMVHFIADSMTQKEVFVMPLTKNIPKFPGIVNFKRLVNNN